MDASPFTPSHARRRPLRSRVRHPGLFAVEYQLHAHGQTMITSIEVQPVLHTTGITPLLHATGAYGTPCHPNLQPSSLFTPHNTSAYALPTPIMPPFVTGYTPHSAIPLALDNPVSPHFSPRNCAVSSSQDIAPGVDLQHLHNIYGQLGVTMQPSLMDPVSVPYFQPPVAVGSYVCTNHYDSMVSMGTAIGSMPDCCARARQKELIPAIYSRDPRLHILATGASNPSPTKGAATSPSNYETPLNIGVVMQYPTSPLASPVFQQSPVPDGCFLGRRNENMRLPFT